MWLGELSERSGVSIPTIKYYRREGLLPPGEAVGAGRAQYGERHLARLRLVRSLVGVGRLPIARVREVLAAVDDDSVTVAAAMGSAHHQLSPVVDEPSERSSQRVARAIRAAGWDVETDGPHARAVAAALDGMDAAESPMTDEALAAYVEGAAVVGRADLAGVADLGRERAVERAVTGTVLGEPVLLALRRLAHEELSRRTRG